MPRVKRGSHRRKKRKRILEKAKGYYQAKSKLYRYAKEAVDRAEKFAYIGRKLKKRDFRALWITRISAAARANELSYSRLINGLKRAGIELNRKMLSEMAIHDPAGFSHIAALAKAALDDPNYKLPDQGTPNLSAPAPEEKPAKKPAAKKAKAEPEPAPAAPADEATEVDEDELSEYDIEYIEGIGPTYGKRMRAAGVETTIDLLKKAANAAARTALAEEASFKDSQVLDWSQRGDLLRIPGVGKNWSELLQVSGATSVSDLRGQDAAALTKKMTEINVAENRARKTPDAEMVAGWIESAKALDLLLEDAE